MHGHCDLATAPTELGGISTSVKSGCNVNECGPVVKCMRKTFVTIMAKRWPGQAWYP